MTRLLRRPLARLVARLLAWPLVLLVATATAHARLLLPEEDNDAWLGVLLEAVSAVPLARSDADDLDALRQRLGSTPPASALGHALVLELATRRPQGVQWLLARGASCDHVEPGSGITPLMAAVRGLATGAPPMPEDSDEDIEALGARAVSWRAPEGAEERAQRNLKAILACARQREARDARNLTAVLVAARHGRIDAVLQLAAAGADINAPDSDGHTAIWHAAPAEFAAMVQAGADIQASTKFGATLLGNGLTGLRGRQVLAYVRAALAAGAHDSRDRRGAWASEAGLAWSRTEDDARRQARALVAATRPPEAAAAVPPGS